MDACPRCSRPNPIVTLRSPSATAGGLIELMRCRADGSFPRCGKRWWRYTFPSGRIIEGGSATNDNALLNQAAVQIPKRVAEIELLDAERLKLRASTVQRLGATDTEDSRKLLAALNPSGYVLDEWEVGFVSNINGRIASRKPLSEQQAKRLDELLEKVKSAC